jgi:TPR repeat protein
MGMADKKYLENRLQAAESGKAEAIYDLGLLYSIGHGVEQNNVKAHKWFNLAAMRGMLSAQIDRAEVADAMSNGEISEAQRKARE